MDAYTKRLFSCKIPILTVTAIALLAGWLAKLFTV